MKVKPRDFINSALIAAFLTALTLASSPQLHERLHSSSPHHECAATIIASGSCEHNASPAVTPKLQDVPASPAFLAQHFRFVIAAVPSSVQEHAPPTSH